MDPNANLSQQLTLARKLAEGCPHESHEDMYGWYQDKADRLADLVLSLDEWLRKGGFIPTAWEKTK